MRAPFLAGLLLLAALAPLGGADHLHASGARAVSFDHQGGNEWWVEVRLGGSDAGAVARVEAMDTGGAWKALEKKWWGSWAASFHVEPGHLVRFAAVFPDGARVESCDFTHPDGQERCGAPPPPPSGSFDASFTGVKGNAWWVQVHVDANQALAGVDARVDGGAWRALALRSWGDWAASFHVPDGALVDFRARAASGETDLSGRYRWPDATPVDGDAPPPPPDAFEALFRDVKGNAWWVQAKVDANRPVAGVDARVEDGDWRPLRWRDWGAWAASFHVPEGAKVQLRARAADGDLAFSHGGWRWPDATPYPPASSAFAAAFHHAKGNAFYVQVNVYADRELAGVDARVDGGAWRALERKTWGDWAGGFSVPDGSRVQFRARAAEGAAVLSGEYLWPDAIPADEARTWPREGSHVAYYAEDGEHSPGGDWAEWDEVNVTLRYQDHRWEALCEGWRYEFLAGREPQTTRERILLKAVFEPPRGPTDVAQGDVVAIPVVTGCGLGGFHFRETTVEGKIDYGTRKNGRDVTASAWQGSFEPDCNCMASHATWHEGTGLVLDWWFGGRASHQTGHLKDTDAPIARDDPPHQPPPPPPGWPFEGSRVAYHVRHHDAGPYFPSDAYLNVSLTYRDGRWQGTCTGTIHDHPTDSQEAAIRHVHQDVSFAPLRGPLRIQEGDELLAGGLSRCTPYRGEPLVARGRFLEETTRNGQPVTTRAWWADETPEDDDAGLDHDAWWDTDTGLLLRWEYKGHARGDLWGRLTDTDAPLG